MQRLTLARTGLWVFAAGILAWTVANAQLGFWVNVATDLPIACFAALAALGLRNAVDGFGPGRLRLGLALVALGQGGQNVVSLLTKLSATNAAPILVVLAASIALAIGAKRWFEDGWDEAALPWVALGFAGFAFEPLYYFGLQVTQGNPFGVFFPGAVLVSVGGAVAAWSFRPGAQAEFDEDEPAEPARSRGGRAGT
jgi:hypothetical protein